MARAAFTRFKCFYSVRNERKHDVSDPVIKRWFKLQLLTALYRVWIRTEGSSAWAGIALLVPVVSILIFGLHFTHNSVTVRLSSPTVCAQTPDASRGFCFSD